MNIGVIIIECCKELFRIVDFFSVQETVRRKIVSVVVSPSWEYFCIPLSVVNQFCELCVFSAEFFDSVRCLYYFISKGLCIKHFENDSSSVTAFNDAIRYCGRNAGNKG